ncbi:hypothetical protein [Litorivivens sp.]|uniref:hypothetical protein n=1 Tax=Litorivivens sp. TaxID=2020868 RepID=UPI00356B22B8
MMNVSELREQIIGPTLKYLGIHSNVAEELLLGTAALESQLNPLHKDADGVGIYRITPKQHRQIWDDYLAFKPDLASRVRGLASQHRFLQDPDTELSWNLSYATAIAWLIYQREEIVLPTPAEADQLGALWRKCFGHRTNARKSEKHFNGWLQEYRRSLVAA